MVKVRDSMDAIYLENKLGVDDEHILIPFIEPRVKSKYKLIQKLFNNLFGYKVNYKQVAGKRIESKAEDFIGQWDGSFTITISEDE